MLGPQGEADDVVQNAELHVFNDDRWYHHLPGNTWHPDSPKRFEPCSQTCATKRGLDDDRFHLELDGSEPRLYDGRRRRGDARARLGRRDLSGHPVWWA